MFIYQLVPPAETDIWRTVTVEKGEKKASNDIAISLKSNDSNSPC